MALVGHTAEEMVQYVNNIMANNDDIKCRDFIISGGIQTALQGYYLTQTCSGNSVYGQAKVMLLAAKNEYETFQKFLKSQVEGLAMAEKYLTTAEGIIQ